MGLQQAMRVSPLADVDPLLCVGGGGSSSGNNSCPVALPEDPESSSLLCSAPLPEDWIAWLGGGQQRMVQHGLERMASSSRPSSAPAVAQAAITSSPRETYGMSYDPPFTGEDESSSSSSRWIVMVEVHCARRLPERGGNNGSISNEPQHHPHHNHYSLDVEHRGQLLSATERVATSARGSRAPDKRWEPRMGLDSRETQWATTEDTIFGNSGSTLMRHRWQGSRQAVEAALAADRTVRFAVRVEGGSGPMMAPNEGTAADMVEYVGSEAGDVVAAVVDRSK